MSEVNINYGLYLPDGRLFESFDDQIDAESLSSDVYRTLNLRLEVKPVKDDDYLNQAIIQFRIYDSNDESVGVPISNFYEAKNKLNNKDDYLYMKLIVQADKRRL